jgi:hypothetical protein
LFSVIAFSHRDDVSSTPAWRPDHHDHAPGQVADRLKSRLTIVAPPIGSIQMAATEDFERIGKVDRPFGEGLRPFRPVERDPHLFIVHPIIGKPQAAV